ncbi:hypothetical protein D3P08_09515 [Paenibacillus nanensis]|uniref:PBP domain-containing protein n=1 Tax=Paenibacillus nanensis TaxID=393251 RepID=A0A3A1V4V4_9BACL|nr:substrate-binding domain-containing protein [Paenibacillus nanensis]RIX53653.1 hypothetical protein D3P08_09515 [Paenibacillus nanensis]
MDQGLWGRLTRGFVYLVFIWVAGCFVMLVASVSGAGPFYVSLMMWLCIGLSISVIAGLGRRLKRRIYWSGIGMLALVFIGAIAAYEANQAYHNRFEKIQEFEVSFMQYEPFTKANKLAKIEMPATLKLTDSLPRLDGATALYPLYASFVQAVYPEKAYDPYESEVIVSRTSQAFNNLVNGKADIVFMAEPSELQKAGAALNDRELKMTPIGADAFVFFTHAGNPVEELSLEQIREIYSGRIANWSEVGGKDADIRAFQRPQDSGSQSALQRLMKGEKLMNAPVEDVVAGMGGIIEQTADYRNYPNAIGFTFLYYASEMAQNKKIKLLAIDGIYPSRENIANGLYPLADRFYAVTAGTDNPNVEPFIEWMLSGQGQELVRQTGYTPLFLPSPEK